MRGREFMAGFVLGAALALGGCGNSPHAGQTSSDGAAGKSADAAMESPPAVDSPAPEVAAPADARVDEEQPTDVGGTDVADDHATLPDGPPASPDADVDATDGGWPAVVNYGARGPFTIKREMNTGPNSAYDVFHPSPLADGRRHPIVSWANGTLFALSDYQPLLEHWASHGFVVIAAHTNSTAGGATHKTGIEWLIAENGGGNNIYAGTLDTAHVAAAGHSQGGGATIAAGAQKAGPLALTTTLPLMPILSFESDKSILGKQTAPMLNINATMDDRDPTGAIANQIHDAAKAELVQAAFIGIHEDAMSAAMFAPTLGWFRFRLMGDAAARAMFYPMATCGLCTSAAWKQVRYANVP
jgi:hypothetical protein